MEKQPRYLHFDNIELGQPISSRCSLCGQQFRGEPKSDETTDGTILRIRDEFNAHNCLKDRTALDG